MVDRHDERNALWQALTQVHRDASSRAVLLTGPSGFGKSRLARWLCERAHETGAAHVLRARWEAMAGPGQGLAAMAMRHLRVQGLAGIELERAVRRWLRERGGGSQLDVVAVIGLLDQEQGRAQAPAERYAAASELLVREAQDRPLVLWLDDLQYSSDALGFAVHLLGQRPVPALIVGTLTDEALAERPVVAAQVAALRAQPGVQALRVGPLPEPSRMELVQRVLAVDDALARRLAERAQGNPLFSIQLLEDWVERGLLTPTPRGFRLAPDAEDDLPADLRAVWRDRVERLLGRQRGDALELAAILGTHVDGAEWLGACLQAGVKPRPDLIERLVSARLAERTDRGLALAHPMLRETLEQRARERGVAQRWHRAAAAHLATLDPWGVSERLGDHLVAAGDLEQALAPLLEGARERQARSDSVLAAAALARRTEAMDRLGLPPEAPERARGWVAESRIDCTSGRVPDGHRKATDALRVLVAAGDDEWACHAANALSYATSRQTGGMPEARRLLLEEALPRAANPEQRAETQHSLAYKSLLLGDTDAAEELMEASMPLLRRSGGNNATAALHLAGLIAQVRGDDRKALAMFEEAAAAMDALGRRASAGILYNSVGDAHRNLGRPRSAVEAFQRSVARFEGLGNPMICFPWINLALLHALEGDADSARAALDQARRHGSESTEGTLQLGIAMNELVLAAMGEDWPEFDRALAVSQRVLEQMSTQERDVVTALLVSADHAQSAGKRARAEAARRLAVPILRAQGRAEEADVLEGELKAAHHAPPGPP